MTSKWRKWDYWVSSLVGFIGPLLITCTVMNAWERGYSCVTFREIGIFLLMVLGAFIGVGWNAYVVLDKYRDIAK